MGLDDMTARIRSQNAQALIPLLQDLTRHTLTEHGCLAYGWYRAGDLFTSMETWASPEAERTHNQTAFLDDILTRILPLLDLKPEMIRWTTLPETKAKV